MRLTLLISTLGAVMAVSLMADRLIANQWFGVGLWGTILVWHLSVICICIYRSR